VQGAAFVSVDTWQSVLTAIFTSVPTALLTAASTFFVTRYTLNRSAANESKFRNEELERHARYLAIRVVCRLDPFVSECCDVVGDSGVPDSEGILTPRVDDPTLTLPEDVDWKTIPSDLMYRILSFPNDLDTANQSIRFVGDEIAFPPDYEEYYDARTLQFGRLGLRAITLADEIRRTYGIPPRDYANWNPRDVLTKEIEETEKRQRERAADIPDLTDGELATLTKSKQGD
jgi:hypothetical protein